MSQSGCGCTGPVETKPFGEEIPDLKTLRIALPSLQPLLTTLLGPQRRPWVPAA